MRIPQSCTVWGRSWLLAILSLLVVGCSGTPPLENPKAFEFVRIEGNQRFHANALKSVVIEQLRGFRDKGHKASYADDAVYLLERFYRKRGYHFVKARMAMPQEGEVELIITISEGPLVALDKVRIHGNREVSTSELQPFVNRLNLSVFGQVFVQREVEEKIDSVLDFYFDRGYMNAKLIRREYSFSEDRSKATLDVWVDEGEAYRLKEVTFTGLRFMSGATLRARIGAQLGSLYRLGLDRKLALRVEAVFQDEGFARARARSGVEVNEGTREISVRIEIRSGRRMRIKEIEVQGEDLKTNPWVIQNLLRIEEGDLYSRSQILEGQKRLLTRELFDVANLSTEPIEGTEDALKLLVELNEAPPGWGTLRAGWGSYEEQRGGFDLGYRNLWGLGHSVAWRNKVSTLGFRTELEYEDPWFLGSAFRFANEAYYEEREEVSFQFDAVGDIVSLTLPVGDHFEIGGGYGWENQDVVKVDDPSLRVDAGLVRDRNLFLRSQLDFRDDPFDPHFGALLTAGWTYGGHQLGGTIDYVAYTGRASVYLPLGADWVFASAARFGVIQPRRLTGTIPISKRFFVGGESTVRGWEQDNLGPKSKRTPIGGESYVIFNEEVRFPLFVDGLKGVMFWDGGQVYESWDDLDADVGDLRWGWGGGLHFMTPLGPIRFEYGRKTELRDNEDSDEFYFSVGYPF